MADMAFWKQVLTFPEKKLRQIAIEGAKRASVWPISSKPAP